MTSRTRAIAVAAAQGTLRLAPGGTIRNGDTLGAGRAP